MKKEKIIIFLIVLLVITLIILLLKQYGKEEIKKEEIKIEFNETKMKENMKLFCAPKGWVVIYNNSLVYVPDDDHTWELAKKGTK